MLFYLFQATFLLLIFSGLYHFLLRDKTTFRFNRWYLIATFLGSFILPLIPFNFFFESATVFQNTLALQPVRLEELVIDTVSKNTSKSINWNRWIEILLLIGALFFFFRFLNELRKLWILYRQSNKEVYDNLVVCKIKETNQVFTFGSVVFMNQDLFENLKEQKAIWQHEKTHAQQWHSLDVLLIELGKIMFWFHPLVYLFEQNIKMNHEYLADEAALKQTEDVKKYQHTLLNYIENTNNPLASAFNFKLTKKRFIMMKKQTKKWTGIAAQIATVFGIIATITFVACSKEGAAIQEIQESGVQEKPLTIVEKKAMPIEGMQNFYQNFVRAFDTESIIINDTMVSTKLRFIVEKDGSFSDIGAVGFVKNEAASEEAIRVLKSMPNWAPAQHEGKIVRSTFTLPIKIRVKP
ncbi:MAG TPA: M56 family metallopeptidase [Flavobacterium sp.]|nr:M56 family metallopeptidase [Flavobacterium sp.]